LEDAARLVVARGRLMQELPEGGSMVAVEASEDEVLPLLPRTGTVVVAAVNAADAVVLSGEDRAVRRVVKKLKDQGRRTTRLRVSHAFHSPLMEPMLAEFRTVVGELSFAAPRVAVSAAAES
ncbi:acyltransferase domain-containing protein, partial [Streptomyces violaceusniger]